MNLRIAMFVCTHVTHTLPVFVLLLKPSLTNTSETLDVLSFEIFFLWILMEIKYNMK